jgi:hypothetical protein
VLEVSTDPSLPEPTTATVARTDSGWVVRIYGADTRLLAETPLAWGGAEFYSEGLDAVARTHAIPDGFAYEGAQAWDKTPDGAYSVVLHRLDPRVVR